LEQDEAMTRNEITQALEEALYDYAENPDKFSAVRLLFIAKELMRFADDECEKYKVVKR
jgi:hypothetical protein